MNDLQISTGLAHTDIKSSPVETDDSDKGRTESTDNERLPPVVIHRAGHQDIQILARLLDRHLVVNNVPVEVMRRKEFTKIQARGLFQEFGLGSMGRIVSKGNEHSSGQVHDLSIDLEDFGGSLNLGFQPV
jgi:hypothetical protein